MIPIPTQRWLALHIAWVALSCAGCPNAASPVPIDSYPETSARVLCERFLACCPDRNLETWFGEVVDLAGCQAEQRSNSERLVARAATTSQRYDAAAAGACLDAVEHMDCAAFSVWTEEEQSRGPCRAIFVGTLVVGQPCTEYDQCAGDLVCTGGTCQAPLAVGADCSDAGSACGRDDHCWEGSCRGAQALGAACLSSYQCAHGLCEDGVCVDITFCAGR